MNWIKELSTFPVKEKNKYSQCGEEIYLGYIFQNLNKTGAEKKMFLVDLGAGDGFALSNTARLLEDSEWTGLLLDADPRGNQRVHKHFISKENICDFLHGAGIEKDDIDLLSIDLDGNDLYILEAILQGGFKPSVIIAEFNPIHPMGTSVAIEYNPDHIWGNDDYYGFSFSAGVKMAAKYGYRCIFQNDNLNMYFVHEDYLQDIEEFPEVSYQVMHGHKESVNKNWIPY